MNLIHSFECLAPGHIVTVVGVGYHDGVPAQETDAGWPMGVVRRADGDLIVCDYQAHRLWRIDQTGILHSFAGDGVPGTDGDGGPALEARFRNPHDLTQDQSGNLYLSDLGNRTIRRIDAVTGIITLVAGNGRSARGGDGGPAVEAELDCTSGVAVDKEGNVYLSDEWACNIRRIDARTGVIDTWAGLNARHYPSERPDSRPAAGSGHSLMGYHGDGGPASEAAFYHPEHLAFDSKDNLYVCDNSNDRIRRIDGETGIITTVLGNGQRASNGDGGPADQASVLMPDAICLDVHDNLYVGEKYGFRVRKVDAASGLVRTLVGNGVPGFGEEGVHGSETTCNSCEAGIWADPDGSVYWGDCSGRLRRYDGMTGIVTTVFGGTSVHDGEQAASAFLCGPGGLSLGPDGHLYVADVWNQRIRSIDLRTGIIRTVAGNGARAYGGDGGPAKNACLGNPHDVSVDSTGCVVIADTRHGHVRRVDREGVIHGVAGAAFQWDKGDGGPANCACLVHVLCVAHDSHDNIYIGDAGVGRIRRIDRESGTINTIAGCGLPGYTGDHGPATEARIGRPTAIRFDGDGNLYFTDEAYHVVRKVDREGRIRTVIGCGEAGFSHDGTPAAKARLHSPFGLAVTSDATIYVSDSYNHRVRTMAPDNTLRTVAGCDVPGDRGDGAAALSASLNEPHGLCLFGDNVLLISDRNNNRIKVMKLGR
ncbi:MAG: SMP-30/gluconolactonase/LRE family protein [Fuerstiella sp.]|nr:SMP-30/gluconolactonase/LRE family protein [Fuerstiella sp.]